MGLRLGASSGQKASEERTEEELSSLITQLTNEIDWYMRARNLTRVDLARRMGVSPGRVSQILSGGENLTLRTLAGVASALDARFDVELKPRQPGPAAEQAAGRDDGRVRDTVTARLRFDESSARGVAARR